MEQLKRSRTIITDECDISKRQKTIVATDECITNFEDLSNELIYEIFEFIDFHHAFQGFYDLNERFQNLFIHSNLPIKINISSISKSTSDHYLAHIITPHTHRIQSLRLSNPFSAEMSLSLLSMMKNLTQLKTLIINDVESNYIHCIIDHLSSLPILSSLTIISIDGIQICSDIYQKIFRLPSLKYCQILIETKQYPHLLPVTTKEFSSIEHLIINNEIAFNQLDSLLSYVPQLRRLSLSHLNGQRSSRIRRSSVTLNYLINVSLGLYSISFNDFELLVTDFFRQVQILHITSGLMHYPIPDMEYLNADRWQQIIASHMRNLRIFDFQYNNRSWFRRIDRRAYETEITKFNSLFWMQHQWFFEYQYYKTKYFDNIILYSTNPYKRKNYILGEEQTNFNLQTNVDSVNHVSIYNTDMMKRFGGHFKNTTELTLTEKFDVPRDSIVTDLNRLIPLRQLVKLSLQCHRLPFEQVIELLNFTPNIHTLQLDSVLLYRMNVVTIEQNNRFQSISNTNTVINLTIDKEITLEKIQLIVALFPRLEYLKMNLYYETLESIMRFLLSKPNNNARYLSYLCISKQRRILIQNLRTLIESEKLLHNYTLKSMNRKLYLWW